LKKMKKRKVKRFFGLYILILPAILYVLIFSYGPMYGIIMAFENYKPKLGYLGSEWVGLKHFQRFISHPDFWKMLKNTISISLYSLATFPCAIILAVMINEVKHSKYKKVVQMVTYAPHFLSTVVVCSLVTMFMGREGVFGVLYGSFTGKAENLLTIPKLFNDIYVWSGVWQSVGWGTIVYLAALAGVSAELIESARIDGANRMQVIWHVNLPGILPTIVTLFIMNTGSILSVGFEKIYLLQNALNLETSRVLSTYVYEVGLQGGQFSYSTAIGLFNNLINIVMIIICNRISKKVSGIGIF